MNLDVIYEDNHIIVVNKPRGILTQGDITGDTDLLTATKDYIKKKYDKKGNVYLGMVQRLDRVTSGVIVFARTSKAASRISKQIQEKKVKKEYLAVVEGSFAKKQGVLTDYLVKNSKKNITYVTKDEKEGKLSKLRYEILQENKNFSLVKICLITGRGHQIRVQLSSRGAIIAGDTKYGSKFHLDKGIALHSYILEFTHPTTKNNMKFFAKLPSDIYFDMFDYIKNEG